MVFSSVDKKKTMSNVEAFCAQQGNALRKPLKFEGRLIKLDPRENVCRQLHERWMRSGGRQMMYADFKKLLRFEPKNDSVSVWLHRDPTAAIVAGVGALGLTTAAAVRAYRVWQNSKASEPDPFSESGVVLNASDVVDCDPQTWNDAPAGTKPSTFEYSDDLKNVPAHLLLMSLNPEPSEDQINAVKELTKSGVALLQQVKRPTHRYKHDETIQGQNGDRTGIHRG